MRRSGPTTPLRIGVDNHITERLRFKLTEAPRISTRRGRLWQQASVAAAERPPFKEGAFVAPSSGSSPGPAQAIGLERRQAGCRPAHRGPASYDTRVEAAARLALGGSLEDGGLRWPALGKENAKP
jgi:hypothetical protein